MKTNKKILAILIAAVMVITLLPSMAFAEGEELCVGGVMVDLVNGSSGDGWSYDPNSTTLTLNGATITGTSGKVKFGSLTAGTTNIYSNNMNLTISLSGDNTVSGGEWAIIVYNGDLTINGGGKLTVTGSGYAEITSDGDMTISGSTVKTMTSGIFAFKSLKITNGSDVTAYGRSNGNAIDAKGVTIEDSTVNVSSGDFGLLSRDGDISIVNSTVIAHGDAKAILSLNSSILLEDSAITSPDGASVSGGNIIQGSSAVTDVTIKPDSVTEDPVLYNLWVGGVQVTSANAENITGDGIKGSVSYDPDTNILTLKDATISGSSDIDIPEWKANIYATGDLNVSFSGTNVVSGNNANIAIYSSGGKIEVTGKGSLTAEGNITGILTYSSVTITDCEQLTVTGHDNSGICGDNGVTIKSSTVTASNCNNYGFTSITEAILIEDSKVIVSDVPGYGICNIQGDVNIKSSTVDLDTGFCAITTNMGSISISDAVIASPEGAAVDGGDILAGSESAKHVVIRPLPLTIKADKSLKPEQDYVEAYKIEPESAMPGDSISVSISLASNYAAAGGKPARVYYKTETDSETKVDIKDLKTEGVTVTGSFEMPKDNVTIYAEWSEPLTEYTVKWLNGDGKELDSKTYLEGESEPVTDKIPVKAEDDEYTYTFDKWDSGTVEGTVKTYKPLFNSSEKVMPEPEPEPVPEVKPV